MSPMEALSAYFKPEIRKNGEDDLRKDRVFLSVAADTQVQALVKTGTGARVSLKARAISAPQIEASCSCAAFAKGSFCRHIWATLLAVKEKHPDFLESKIELVAGAAKVSPDTTERKLRQAEFKRAQAARLKEKNKLERLEKKNRKRAASRFAPSYSPEVQSALDYFDQNGFALKDSMDEASIQIAKKKLSRVFHPDRGGTHEEIIALNHHAEVLLKNLV